MLNLRVGISKNPFLPCGESNFWNLHPVGFLALSLIYLYYIALLILLSLILHIYQKLFYYCNVLPIFSKCVYLFSFVFTSFMALNTLAVFRSIRL